MVIIFSLMKGSMFLVVPSFLLRLRKRDKHKINTYVLMMGICG